MKPLTQAPSPQPKPCPQPPLDCKFKEAKRSKKGQKQACKTTYAQPSSARSSLCLSRCSSLLLMRDSVCRCIGRLLIRSTVAMSLYWTLTWWKAVRHCGSGSRRGSFMIGSSIHVERLAFEEAFGKDDVVSGSEASYLYETGVLISGMRWNLVIP